MIPRHRCQQDLLDERGICSARATERCYACRERFCEECLIDHLHSTLTLYNGRPIIK